MAARGWSGQLPVVLALVVVVATTKADAHTAVVLVAGAATYLLARKVFPSARRTSRDDGGNTTQSGSDSGSQECGGSDGGGWDGGGSDGGGG